MNDITNILQRVKRDQDRFINSEFIVPILPETRYITTDVSGVKIKLKLTNNDNNPSWKILTTKNMKTASIIRDADLDEILSYKKRFNKIRFIILYDNDDDYICIPASKNDNRVEYKPTIIKFINNSNSFDTIYTHCIYGTYWFDDIDYNRSIISDSLKEELSNESEINKVKSISGITPEELDVYRTLLKRKLDSKISTMEDRLKHELSYLGGELRDYSKDGTSIKVNYYVDGELFTSIVDPINFTNIVAGICLNDGDTQYNLRAMPGIIRSGIRQSRIHRTIRN